MVQFAQKCIASLSKLLCGCPRSASIIRVLMRVH